MLYQDKIAMIVGKKLMPDWIAINPKIYYWDGEPYGLIGKVKSDDTIVLACTTSSPEEPFTIGMLRDIIGVYKTNDICLITDGKEYHNRIKNTLNRYGFEYVINDDDVMFSSHKVRS